MFRICFVWVYIIKGFCPLIRGKQTLVCEGFAICGEQSSPLLSLQASAGFVWCTLLFAYGRLFSRLPKVVLCKGKQNGLFRVLLSYKFLRQYAVLSLFISERLEMTDQRFKYARQRSQNVVWR